MEWENVVENGDFDSFPSGAVRDSDEGKPRYDLIPVTSLTRLAYHYANGAKRYGDNNWRKGIPPERCLASTLRHIYAYMQGKDDEDHLSAAVFNLFALIDYQERGMAPEGFWSKLNERMEMESGHWGDGGGG